MVATRQQIIPPKDRALKKAVGARADRLTPLLRQPARAGGWTAADWDLAVREARYAGLLGRLHGLLADENLLETVPAPAREHLVAADVLARKHMSDVAREVRYIAEALDGVAAPVILLKGASYVLAGLPPARGRLFGDIDILVPRDGVQAVEAALVSHGWRSAKQDAYDQRYYREWMHEIPPLQHEGRKTTIDVHHTIVPPTAGLAVDARRLREAAQPVGDGRIAVLAPRDMVLHSAVHLFNEGEFDHGLRDLDDLNRLLRHFSAEPGFWPSLVARAVQFRLQRPLYYALRYAAALLATPVPEAVLADADLVPSGTLRRRLMDEIFYRALRPPHPLCADALGGVVLRLLYIRAHYLRMPLRLLLPHLLRKAVVRRLAPAEA